MHKKLHIDIETYSGADIKKAGLYRYMEDKNFEILMIAYAFDDEPVEIIDLAAGENMPTELIEALRDPKIEKHAHNATFERTAFRRAGIDIPAEQWHCTMVHAAYCGLPLSLAMVSEALGFGSDKAKASTGKALIRYFCIPCRPTKTNGQRTRNYWHHDSDKWEAFKAYCIQDVEAEREIDNRLINYPMIEVERSIYLLDQKINDAGLLVDTDFATIAANFDERYKDILKARIKEITGLANPNSGAQLKSWLGEKLGKEVKSLAKDKIGPLLEGVKDPAVLEVLKLKQKISKTSTKKYPAMLNCVCADDRARGLLQFYGANRTGRWGGRLIQPQNLPRNYIEPIELARDVVAKGEYEVAEIMYGDMTSLLSQLIRTSFIAGFDRTFGVADFSAIEARVIAWLADESWRLEVFSTHGKIYEASASMMFNVPIEQVTKGSDLRYKGKTAELALGYQGSVGAMRNMGGEAMGLSDQDMKMIVKKWRTVNPKIVQLWKDVEAAAIRAVKTEMPVYCAQDRLLFECDGQVLTIQLPSGRKLYYQEPSFYINKFEKTSIQYKGMVQATRKWDNIGTYGGKLVENIIQAIARDLLAASMLALDKEGFNIVFHVHDEAITEIPVKNQDKNLAKMCEIMRRPISWAEGLPLDADGYLTPFYKKD